MSPREAVRQAAHLVAAEVGLPVQAVLAPAGWGWSARRARHLVWYLAVVGLDLSTNSVSRDAGLPRRTVRWAVTRIEERRDDPVFDRRLSRLEQKLQRGIAA